MGRGIKGFQSLAIFPALPPSLRGSSVHGHLAYCRVAVSKIHRCTISTLNLLYLIYLFIYSISVVLMAHCARYQV